MLKVDLRIRLERLRGDCDLDLSNAGPLHRYVFFNRVQEVEISIREQSLCLVSLNIVFGGLMFCLLLNICAYND